MKRVHFFIVTLGLLVSSINSAQNNWCFTDQYNQQLLSEMPASEREKVLKEHYRLFEEVSQSSMKESGVVYTIPLVVHVIHDNCSGNISKAQIEDGIRVMNDDYRRLNSDTGQTRALFKPFAGDAEIQFKLAQIDPNGHCTEGIVRINSELTYDADNSVKSLSFWPSNKYLNVWLVNSIASSGPGIILGYAQFPNFGNWNTYGLVVRNDSWGTIGTGTRDGRTPTHEVGHCLGLYHTFQSGCGNGCSSSGDRICDTPPSREATYGCDQNQNTCSNDQNGPSPYTSNVVDQIENYMSYDHCTNMFTKNQIDRMRNSLSSINQLSNLVSQSNLVATGTNPGFVPQDCEPIADFCQEKISICEGAIVSYDDASYNGAITSINWSFEGGSPASSPNSNVNVAYNTAGVYDVSLTVGNSAGSDTKTRKDVINVYSKNAKYDNWVYREYFEDKTKFDDDWVVQNPSGGKEWELTTKAAYSGERSVYLNNNINGFDLIDELITPSFNLNSVKNPVLKLKVAYAKKSSASADEMKVYYSYTCGQFWSIISVLNADEMVSVDQNVFGDFAPKDESEWRDVSIKIPGFIKTRTNVRFKFEFNSGGGNNVFMDDFAISNISGISEIADLEFKIYPNPATDVLNIDMGNYRDEVKQILLRDLSGRTLLQNRLESVSGNIVQLNTAGLSEGIYFAVIRGLDGSEYVKKIIVQ